MRIILFFAMILITSFAQAQTWYSSTEYQISDVSKTFKFSEANSNYTIFNFTSYTGKKGWGVFVMPIVYKGGFDISVGPLYSNEDSAKHVFIEGGIAPGMTFTKDAREFFSQLYFYLETKSQHDRAPGKFILLNNTFYTPESKSWWVMSSASIGITKWLGFRIHAQTDGAVGPGLELNLPHVQLWGARGKNTTIGLNITFE